MEPAESTQTLLLAARADHGKQNGAMFGPEKRQREQTRLPKQSKSVLFIPFLRTVHVKVGLMDNAFVHRRLLAWNLS